MKKLLFLWLFISIASLHSCTCFGQSVPFAKNGTLKMLYDNRMHPQAVEYKGSVYIVWRGQKGFPYIISYDLDSRKFSKPFMLLTGMEDKVDANKYARDHHYAPVIWVDSKGHFHVLFGCHVISGGVHLISKKPGVMTQWQERPSVSDSVSYPQVHRIYGDKTLIYFRHRGHLGSWTYSVSSDSGRTWVSPENAPVDLDAEPQNGFRADDAASYHNTCVGKDGRTLHVAFIWMVEGHNALDEVRPFLNSRYSSILQQQMYRPPQRFNLYYIRIDLPSGKVFNYAGKELTRPINKQIADRQCLIWDTEMRVAAVPPSIYLDENEQPYFLLAVSDETPYKCWFYFVSYQNNHWIKTAIARTAHPFNACHLLRTDNGMFKAYLITGEGENISKENMDSYGWGDRVEEWISDDNGKNWKLSKDITPIKGYKYQNVKSVSRCIKGTARDMILFYGWQDSNRDGTAFLWDDKE